MDNGKKLEAVFVGDSKRYHKFQILDGEVVGTLYFPKAHDSPKKVAVVMTVPADKRWGKCAEELLSRGNPDSKGYIQLLKTIENRG